MSSFIARSWMGLALVRAAIFAVVLAISVSTSLHAQAPVELGGQEAIRKLAEHLSERRGSMLQALALAGFQEEVQALRQQVRGQIDTFSADSILENFYRRAEAAEVGQGNRLLALLYHQAAARSAAVRDDPTLRKLGQSFGPEAARRPYRLATQAALEAMPRAPLSPAAEAAVASLSDFHGARGLAASKAAILRAFEKPGFDVRTVERTLATSRTTEEALRKLIDAGTPPPTTEAALRRLMLRAFSASAAFSSSRNALQVMEELSRETAPEQRRYAEVEGQLGSREEQFAEGEKKGWRTRERTTTDSELLAGLTRPPDEPPVPSSGAGGPPGPGGGGSPPKSHFDGNAQRYQKFDSDTFEPRPNSASPASPKSQATGTTPRNYSKARVSSRAGRGVSAGGVLRSDVTQPVVEATWMSNSSDDRFGRLFVTLKDGSGTTIAASRPMFTDSFRAALSAVHRQAPGSPSEFREGEILVLMSMEPPTREQAAALSGRMKALQARADEAVMAQLTPQQRARVAQLDVEIGDTTKDDPARFKAFEERREIIGPAIGRVPAPVQERLANEFAAIRAERPIVLHPALAGRELGWSAARVDFWTNRPRVLAKEAMQIAGDVPPPSTFEELPFQDITTWQYYERDAVIEIRPGSKARQLVVRSGTGPAATRSHFSIALFSDEKGPEGIPKEDDLFQRPDAERKLQPILDWLATRHHDFMRLNDFSESFSLLRWLRSQRVSVSVLDIAGERARLATPDRVDMRTGPKIGN